MEYPKISIVSPSYNQGQFIEDAIISVLNQNYPNFEHIIIDGGSTDDTLKILTKYPHLNWSSERDNGQSDALNKGFKKATGDIIGWLNTDDIYLSGVFFKIAEELHDPTIHAVYGNLKFIDVTGKQTDVFISHHPSRFLSLFHGYIPSATFFFKRQIIDQNIFIDSSYEISMDKEFFAHLFFLGYCFKYIPQYLAAFRWHAQNKSLNVRSVQLQTAREGLLLLNKYAKLKFPVNQFSIRIYRMTALSLVLIKKIYFKVLCSKKHV